MMASALETASESMPTAPPPASSISTKDSTTASVHSTTSNPSSTSTAPSPPFIPIPGILNFRSLGSYPCHPPPSHPNFPPNKSYIIRPDTLFRSAQPTALTPLSTSTITTTLQIRKIYDLRSQREIDKQANKQPTGNDGLERIHIPVFSDQDYSPEALVRKYHNYAAPDEDDESSHGHSAGFVRAYRDIARSAGPAFRTLFEHIRDGDIPTTTASDDGSGASQAQRPEPLLFHCAAGKDRTGVFAALVLRLCGVADEVVAWEYGLTEIGLGEWSRRIVEYMMKGGEVGSGRPAMKREEAERAVGSRPGNMLVFLREVVDGEFGGVERYMQEFCGISAGDVEVIRRRLVVEGESGFGDGRGYWREAEVLDGDEAGPLGLAKGDGMGRKREERVMTG